jgi:hypothetical protein
MKKLSSVSFLLHQSKSWKAILGASLIFCSSITCGSRFIPFESKAASMGSALGQGISQGLDDLLIARQRQQENRGQQEAIQAMQEREAELQMYLQEQAHQQRMEEMRLQAELDNKKNNSGGWWSWLW